MFHCSPLTEEMRRRHLRPMCRVTQRMMSSTCSISKHYSPSKEEDKALLAMSLAEPLVQPKAWEESFSEVLGTKPKDEDALFMTWWNWKHPAFGPLTSDLLFKMNYTCVMQWDIGIGYIYLLPMPFILSWGGIWVYTYSPMSAIFSWNGMWVHTYPRMPTIFSWGGMWVCTLQCHISHVSIMVCRQLYFKKCYFN